MLFCDEPIYKTVWYTQTVEPIITSTFHPIFVLLNYLVNEM